MLDYLRALTNSRDRRYICTSDNYSKVWNNKVYCLEEEGFMLRMWRFTVYFLLVWIFYIQTNVHVQADRLGYCHTITVCFGNTIRVCRTRSEASCAWSCSEHAQLGETGPWKSGLGRCWYAFEGARCFTICRWTRFRVLPDLCEQSEAIRWGEGKVCEGASPRCRWRERHVWTTHVYECCRGASRANTYLSLGFWGLGHCGLSK